MTRFPNFRALVRELGDHDDRQLMDIGLVRAAEKFGCVGTLIVRT